jgi:hypothetical protein
MEEPEPENIALDEDGSECAAADSDEEIVDETLHQSSIKNSTRSKYRKFVVPEPLRLSDSEDEDPDGRFASVIVPVQLCYEQVDTPDISDATRISSQVSPARGLLSARVRLAGEDESDQLKTACQETTRPWRRH